MPDWIKADSPPRQIGLLLFERFSNHCFANTLEPLRAANGFLSRPAYNWRVLTLDGEPVQSSSGVRIVPDAALADMPRGDALILLPSYGYRRHVTPSLSRALRAASGRFDTLMGFDTGSWLLAEAGLLTGRRATIHFDEFDPFAERFPDIDARRERWVDDGDRITAGGAMIAFELMCRLIGQHHGMALATEVATLFMTGEGPADGPQLHPAGDTRVARALEAMAAHVEQPLPIAEIARRAGCSQRQLEARFHRRLGTTPRRAYQRLRLNAARRLVTESGMGVAEIATRCGYDDSSAFTRAFRAAFGQSPRAMRR